MSKIVAYTDGACRGGNPGFCSAAWAIYFDGKVDSHGARYLGPERHTNNYAEYMALICLLEVLYSLGIEDVTIYCDSKLVVNQVNQKWKLNSEGLRPLMSKAFGFVSKGNHTLIHIRGHQGIEGNEFVDKLCNEELDRQGH